MFQKLFLLFMALLLLGGCASYQRKGVTVFISGESIPQEKMRSLDGNIVISYIVYRETSKNQLETVSLDGGKTIFVTGDTRRIFMDLRIQNKTGTILTIQRVAIDESGKEIKKEVIGTGKFNGFSLIIDFPVKKCSSTNQIEIAAGDFKFETEKVSYMIRK